MADKTLSENLQIDPWLADGDAGNPELDQILSAAENGQGEGLPSLNVDLQSVIKEASNQPSYSGLPDFLKIALPGPAGTISPIMNTLAGGDFNSLTGPEQNTVLRDMTGAGTGIGLEAVGVPWYLSSPAQAAASRGVDALSEFLGILPQESVGEQVAGTLGEGVKNVGVDALLSGTGKILRPFGEAVSNTVGPWSKKWLPGRKEVAEQALRIGEDAAARTGQGALTSRESMGGLDNAAEFFKSRKPLEINAYNASGFDAKTGKFIENPKQPIYVTRDILQSKKIKQQIAETRNGFLKQIDQFARKNNIPSFDGDSVASEVKNFADDLGLRDSFDPSNDVIGAEFEGIMAPYIDGIKKSPTFDQLQKIIGSIDRKIRRGGGYDDAGRRIENVAPSLSDETISALKATRGKIRDLIPKLANANPKFHKLVPPEADATAGTYLDRLNTAYQATRIVGDDYDSLIEQMARQNTQLSQRALKDTSAASFLTRPAMATANAVTGGQIERTRQMGLSRTLEDRVPQQMQDIIDVYKGRPVPTSPLRKFWGDSVNVFDRVSHPIARQAIPIPTFMATVSATLAPEEAQAIETQLQQAAQSADPLAEERIMGSAVAMFPELRSSFTPSKTTANSEWGGIIADPMEKIAIKGKLQQHVQAGDVDSITAAKFAMKLNKDEPFTSVPKPLRGREMQPALPSAPSVSLAPSAGSIQELAPDLAQPLDFGLPPGLPTLQ